MAKRSRGAARPGQRPTTRRPQQRTSGRAGTAATADAIRPSARPIAGETLVDLDLPVEEREPVGSRRERAAATVTPVRSRSGQPSGLLAARAAEEYGYVARDVRHIGVVGGGLFVILIALFLLNAVTHILTQ